ncbi:MAG: TonB-dependent receptor [Acidobacteria bacterium]|nr:TonB-dependent receptor [Acidobacteriota bacterium]
MAQSDRGTLTGTVSDPTGALVPNAEIAAVNPATGVQMKTAATNTGNFTIASVPAGVYDLSVEAAGFKKFEQKGIRVQVAQSARIDVVLQIGSTSESISVTADAPLLRTENAAQATTISRDQLNQLPVNFAIGAGAVRNPLSFLGLTPGASIAGWNTIKINGAPTGTFKIVFEGQDSTSALDARVSDESQPSVEAIEEFTLQTSNFAAEFGQVGGGLFNFTSRSGTNEYHGTVYDYFAHESVGAAQSFSNVRPRLRRHDMGASVGGPVILPKVYDGRQKTFFFFNYEMYRDIQNRFDNYATVPIEAYRNGDFSAALTGRNLGTDGLGRAILENVVYDPRTARTVSGRVYRDPFAGNIVPRSAMDPVALKIQDLYPKPMSASLINNFEKRYQYRKIQDIPSFKIDHNLGDGSRLSVYYARQRTDKDNGHDGLPDPISARRDQLIRSNTVRLNFDRSLTTRLLLHLGGGYQRYFNPDSSPQNNMDFDAAGKLGLKGAFGPGFPRITGINSSLGGMIDNGPTNRGYYIQDKETAVASLTFIRGNHSYKAGGEWKLDNFTNRSTGGVPGNFGFSSAQSGLPALQGVALPGGGVGFPYASFLLGMANSASVSNPADPQYRRKSWGFFVQDAWKITRKLTLDYGLRYDWQPAPWELHNRMSMFSPDVKNPSAGGLLGGTLYAGSGPGRCNCDITKTYPYGLGPRLGLAYQMDPKTVLRAGLAVSYGQVTQFNYIGGGQSLGMGFNSISLSTPAYGEAAVMLQNGMSYNMADLLGASYDPGIRPLAGQTNSPPSNVDRNAGRPPRIVNWNLSVQREITRNLSVEAAYVGNRGVWFKANSLVDYNATQEERLKAFGLDIHKAADRTLLTSRMDSPAVIAAGFKAPYAGFPMSSTLAQALRPYPQFGGLGTLWAPLGNNWYDSLQVKVTKRLSHGLDFTVAYTWSKTLTTVEGHDGASVPLNDVFNRRNQKTLSYLDQPHAFVTGFTYEVPKFGANKVVSALARGWTLGGVLRYGSGYPIRVPASNNALGSLLQRGTFANRVPGEPLFLKDLNCHCIDPNKEFVLNPKAWSDPAPGEWGTSAVYYSDYRGQRRPSEQLSLGRIFRITERMRASVRAEFFNVFNRTYMVDPDSGNFQATQSVAATGRVISGFGRINTGATTTQDFMPRSGQVVLRFQF